MSDRTSGHDERLTSTHRSCVRTANGTKKTAHELATVIRDIEEKLEENSYRNSQLETRRAKVALAATQGDQAALDELDAIKADEALFAERARNLTAAKTEAYRQHDAAAEAERAARYVQTLRNANQLITEAVAASEEVDRALAAIAGPLNRRKAALERLARLQVVDAERVIANLTGTMQSAFETAGLPELFGQATRGLGQYGTLAEFTRGHLHLTGKDRALLEGTP